MSRTNELFYMQRPGIESMPRNYETKHYTSSTVHLKGPQGEVGNT